MTSDNAPRREPRDQTISTRTTAAVKAALARVAERSGRSQASVLDRLILGADRDGTDL